MAPPTTTYSAELSAAGSKFPYATDGFALFTQEPAKEWNHILVKLRLQAPLIMSSFEGTVKYDKDPKGILFYNSIRDLHQVGDTKYVTYYFKEKDQPDWIIVRVEFYAAVGGTQFATFVAHANTKDYDIPRPTDNQVWTSEEVKGKWKPVKSGVSETQLFRMSRSKTVDLRLHPLIKGLSFDITKNVGNDDEGDDILGNTFFVDKRHLDNMSGCKAEYSADCIQIRNGESKYIALFIPHKPAKNIGSGIASKVDSRDYDEPDQSLQGNASLATRASARSNVQAEGGFASLFGDA